MRLPKALGLVSALALAAACGGAHANDRDDHSPTATPIKHVVVIFQENVSFDHYFGTYPNALNLSGETKFMASPRTPKVNSLATPLDVNHHFAPLDGRGSPQQQSQQQPHQSGGAQQQQDQRHRRVEPVPPVAVASADRGSGAQRKPGGKRL